MIELQPNELVLYVGNAQDMLIWATANELTARQIRKQVVLAWYPLKLAGHKGRIRVIYAGYHNRRYQAAIDTAGIINYIAGYSSDGSEKFE